MVRLEHLGIDIRVRRQATPERPVGQGPKPGGDLGAVRGDGQVAPGETAIEGPSTEQPEGALLQLVVKPLGELAGVPLPERGVDRAAQDHGVPVVQALHVARGHGDRLVAAVPQDLGHRLGDRGSGAKLARVGNEDSSGHGVLCAGSRAQGRRDDAILPREALPREGVRAAGLQLAKGNLMTETQKSARRTADNPSDGFTTEERAAMKERAKELKAAGRRGSKGDGERDVLAKIAELAEPDRGMAERLHALVKASAPELSPRTWYGMPAYAKDGKVICFFQAASKFKVRYATVGFQPDASLDEGTMWPVAFALTELTAEAEEKLAALVKKAVS